MQDIGREEDTELSRKDSTLNWRELSVESLGNCQSVGNWIFLKPECSRQHNEQEAT